MAGVEFVPIPSPGVYYRKSPGSMSTYQKRMLETRTEVFLQAFEGFSRSPELLTKWGGELAEVARRIWTASLASESTTRPRGSADGPP